MVAAPQRMIWGRQGAGPPTAPPSPSTLPALSGTSPNTETATNDQTMGSLNYTTLRSNTSNITLYCNSCLSYLTPCQTSRKSGPYSLNTAQCLAELTSKQLRFRNFPKPPSYYNFLQPQVAMKQKLPFSGLYIYKADTEYGLVPVPRLSVLYNK